MVSGSGPTVFGISDDADSSFAFASAGTRW